MTCFPYGGPPMEYGQRNADDMGVPGPAIRTSAIKLTDAQKSALKWLKYRGGDGVFDKGHVLNARGERAGVMVATWIVLENEGMVERYANRKRLKITPQGNLENLAMVGESETA